MKKISILIPCYNEEQSLPLLYEELKKLSQKENSYSWEFLFVNDGSFDNTLEELKKLRQDDNQVCYIDLSRNYGKECAMLAGFDYATGDCMVIMDADLQHPPFVVSDMLRKWEEGYDDVYGERITRGKESWLRKRLSLFFYKIIDNSSKVKSLPNVGDFRLLDRKCIDAIKMLREQSRYTKGMFTWIGFKKVGVPFETQDRVAGTSSWNFWGLFKLAIEGITSSTTFPLKMATYIGLIVSLVAFIYMIFIMCKTLFFGEIVRGYTTLMMVILFLGGIILFSLGILGEYIGRIFNETKNRPTYFIREYNGEK